MQSSARAQVWSIVAVVAALVAVSALWIVNLRLGPPLEGFTGGPMVVAMPAALILVVVLWLAARGLFRRRWRSVATSVIGAAVLAYVVVAVWCGPVACFAPGANRLLGWFVVGGAAFTAVVHQLVSDRLSGGPNVAS